MILNVLKTGPLEVNCYILGCEEIHQGIIIDPGGDHKLIKNILHKMSIRPGYILLTHGHWDHIGAVRDIKEEYNSEICLHSDDNPLYIKAGELSELFGFKVADQPSVDRFLNDNEIISVGNLRIKCLHTPGHSRGGMSFLIKNSVFTGDLLFAGGVGRCDFPGGNYETLVRSIHDRIFTLPDDTVVYPGHGPSTTVIDEKEGNPYL